VVVKSPIARHDCNQLLCDGHHWSQRNNWAQSRAIGFSYRMCVSYRNSLGEALADAADAESYAEDHWLKDWWIARLISPEAFADRHWKRLRAARMAAR
jgi:hypothetical protein